VKVPAMPVVSSAQPLMVSVQGSLLLNNWLRRDSSNMKFTDLDLPDSIQQSLAKMGFVDQTPIQEATFPILTAGDDLCALAETGSGKTAACMIPLVPKIDPKLNEIQGLVIVPTRELCLQYVQHAEDIAKRSGVVSFAVYGGFSKAIQMTKLNHEVHILVATPRRLIDLMYDGVIEFPHIKWAILDEADELLKEGFFEDIEFILSCIRQEHQTLLFSATMDKVTKKLADDVLREPRHLSLIDENSQPASIDHYFNSIHPKEKLNYLTKYLQDEDIGQVIIFSNARHGVDSLFRDLRKKIKGVEYIHAGLSQDKRSSIFRKFKQGQIKVMIATDVAGRGLDFSKVTHVINWDLPRGSEQYTHRTGRCGRMGRAGKALSLITRRNHNDVKKLMNQKKIKPIWIGRNPLQDGNDSSQGGGSKSGKPRRRRSRNRGPRKKSGERKSNDS